MSALEIGIGDVAQTVRGVTYEKQDARSAPEAGYVPLLGATNIEIGRASCRERV